ncbi:MAG: NAD(P)H-hydrate dehydratase [bacterium]|jgi:hydroxyethylthiazole kinase-like uncharacterized protein yjeF|nr:NAD(P)H-hydrate dehydratase [Bacillota bacterium]HHW55888.1 NAD(P)H-hydrate dehydratase [Bacillota bacterium]
MWVVTAAQMRERDRWAIEEVGLPGLVLMENAGRQVAALARRLLDEGGAGKKAWIFAGKGNNGGDGLVAARYLARAGVQVETFLLAREGELRGDAAANLQICRQLGLPLVELHSSADLAALAPRRAGVDLIIDALLGTGIRGPVQGFLAEVISFINEGGSPVLAIDLPSGLEADTGVCPGPVVKATDTVTLDLPKWGLCLYPGADRVGRLWVADIGMPPGAPLPEPGVFLTTPRELTDLQTARPPESHKGSWGRVLVVAGSQGMAGAAVLAARGALRSGAGLVTVASPAGVQPTVAAHLAEAMTYPLPQTPAGGLGRAAEDELLPLLEWASVLALGPGLGREGETQELVCSLLPRLKMPVVIDADGLTALVGRTEFLRRVPGPVVITPHPGEMARLCGITPEEVQANRLALARQKAAEWQVTLVLKGARTIIAAPDGRAAINPTGNPGLATGGTGDVLTGIIAGLLGQGLPPFTAAVAGAFLHGAAGDLAAREMGEAGLLAGDVALYLPAAWQALKEGIDLLPFLEELP